MNEKITLFFAVFRVLEHLPTESHIFIFVEEEKVQREKRQEIEVLLTFLFDDLQPKDDRVGQY